MMLERKWMYERWDGTWLNQEFIDGVEEFLEFAKHENSYVHSGELRCPCSKCKNKKYLDVESIRQHLYKSGFVKNYYEWVCHGEKYSDLDNPSSGADPHGDMDIDELSSSDDGMQEEFEEGPNPEAKKLFDMLSDAEKPLYEGCKMSMLKMASRIINLKSEHNLTYKCIDAIAALMSDFFPDRILMTRFFFDMRRVLEGLELPHVKIHACVNGCILFWRENEHLDKCWKCGRDRYKMTSTGKMTPVKVLTYFPITPRLQRLYATEYIAKQMRWHSEHTWLDGVMKHPSEGEAWMSLDKTYPDFAADPRNVRLGLCTGGFTPFGKSRSNYSCCPVIVTPYNLPPWLCMKNPFMFLTLLIPGPKGPKWNLDVFLQPVIDELKGLWEFGALTYDMSRKQNFMMRAVLLWTISDFHTYDMLSGWSTSGKLACPYCMMNSKSFWLKHGEKVSWFDCHRQFLCKDHPLRRNRNAFFKNRVENDPPPLRLRGDQIWDQVSGLPKSTDRDVTIRQLKKEKKGWYKQSIFWKLPYWKSLLIRHNLDVMHIEKEVFEQLIHTVMDVEGQTQDTLNARRDIHLYCRRPSLELIDDGKGGFIMPKASYVLDKTQCTALCEWIESLQSPDGYPSDLNRCVDMSQLKLSRLKHHDCHVFMERLIPVAFKELLPANVWKVVTELSQFFRDICASTILVDNMARLSRNIPEILCKLEKIFPPSFFDCMEHLPVHLPFEASIGGPIQYRWMYQYDRKMFNLKRKIGNKVRVEGSISDAYLAEEISNFCTHYFESHADTKTRDVGRNETSIFDKPHDPNMPEVFHVNMGRPTSKGKHRLLCDKEYKRAHLYTLTNCESLIEYKREFERCIQDQHPNVQLCNIWSLFEKQYPIWLEKFVSRFGIKNDALLVLAMGPSFEVQTWESYCINGFDFHTYDYGKRNGTMNYGVCVESDDGLEYFGIILEVLELTYIGSGQTYRTIFFKCDWFDPVNGVYVHPQYKLVEVNHRKRYRKYDPFVLAYKAQQVCYVYHPSVSNDISNWWAVLKMKPRPNSETQAEDVFQEAVIKNPPVLSEVDNLDEGAENEEGEQGQRGVEAEKEEGEGEGEEVQEEEEEDGEGEHEDDEEDDEDEDEDDDGEEEEEVDEEQDEC